MVESRPLPNVVPMRKPAALGEGSAQGGGFSKSDGPRPLAAALTNAHTIPRMWVHASTRRSLSPCAGPEQRSSQVTSTAVCSDVAGPWRASSPASATPASRRCAPPAAAAAPKNGLDVPSSRRRSDAAQAGHRPASKRDGQRYCAPSPTSPTSRFSLSTARRSLSGALGPFASLSAV